jgi:hypothetical protein
MDDDSRIYRVKEVELNSEYSMNRRNFVVKDELLGIRRWKITKSSNRK